LQPFALRRRDVDDGRLTVISFRAQSLNVRQARKFRERSSVSPPGQHPMESDPKASYATEGLRALAQPVAAPLTRAAMFLVVTLKPGTEVRSIVRGFCADLSAILRAVETRDLEAALSCIMGVGSEAWDSLFGPPRPALLHPFREIRSGGRHAVSTPGDLLFHIRSKRMDLCFELSTQIMARIGEAVTPEDEVQGFRYFDDRDLIGFVDGTENPRGQEAVDAVTIGGEDPAFSGGSYVIVQKYLHDMAGWEALSTEAQERIIGRKKMSDIELDGSVKPSSSHSSLTTIVENGVEMKILRDNMPFGRPSLGEFGTYFIGYSRNPAITELMLENMFVGRPPGNYDRLLDFSRAVTGTLFFVPSASFLDDVSDEEAADADSSPAPDADEAAPSGQPAAAEGGSLGIGSLKGDPQ
jgi:putative iron-dependent peroxidase